MPCAAWCTRAAFTAAPRRLLHLWFLGPSIPCLAAPRTVLARIPSCLHVFPVLSNTTWFSYILLCLLLYISCSFCLLFCLFGSCCLDARGTVHPLGECFDDARIASGPDSATETPRRTMEGGCLRVHAWLGNDFSQRRQDYGRRNNRPRMDHGLRMLKMLDNFAAATTKMTRRRCFLLQRYRGDEDAAVCANVAQGLLMGP